MNTQTEPRPKPKQVQAKGGTKTHVTLDGLALARFEYCRAALTRICGGMEPSSSTMYRLALDALVDVVEDATTDALLHPGREQKEWRRRLRAAAECNEAPPLPIPDPDSAEARWPRFSELYRQALPSVEQVKEQTRRVMSAPFTSTYRKARR